MRAVYAVQAGGPEVLEFRDAPEPTLGAADVLIEIRATALNRADLLQRKGLYPPPAGTTDILGLECAGTIVQVGEDVPQERLGRRVMCLLGGGGYAERVAVPERLTLPIPEALSFEAAAAIPEAFLTAHEALFQLARLVPGEPLLIHAAASGVGSAAVQLAVSAGARVFATAGGANKCARVAALGATCFDRHEQDFAVAIERELGPAAVAVVLDFVGSSYFDRHCQLLAPGGRLVCAGWLSGARVNLDLGVLIRKRLQILGIVMRSRSQADKIAMTLRFGREVLPRFESGELAPVVDCVMPWSDVQAAHARLESNANIGKIVLSMA
jgi:tumor protein p53-inducible protein 3